MFVQKLESSFCNRNAQWWISLKTCSGSWQGIDKSSATSARAVKISWYIILLIQFLLQGQKPGRRYFYQGICPGTPWCGAATEEEQDTPPRKSRMTTRGMKDYPNLCSVQAVFIVFLSLLCILHRNKLCHHQLLTTGRIDGYLVKRCICLIFR